MCTERRRDPTAALCVKLSVMEIKFVLGWVAVFLFRLIPFRPPNFEPMLSTVMPFSKRCGILGSFLFGFLGIVFYDAVTSGWGSWTWVAAFSYGTVGIAAHFYFKNREATVMHFLTFGIPATVAYDAVTMMIGPIFAHQPFAIAFTGQIPFTLMHLVGTVTFATLLSPLLYRWLVHNGSFNVVILSWFRKKLLRP